MGFYAKHILPRAIHIACKHDTATKQRLKVVPLAEGRVLEVGIGSGLNLPFYDSGLVHSVVGIDPQPQVWRRRETDPAGLPFPFEFLEMRAEQMDLDNKAFDTVVVTFTLCSIDRLEDALGEIRRVLKPSGMLLFSEHGRAPDPVVQKWQKRIDPVWRLFSGGCSLSKDIPGLIQGHGFKIGWHEERYISGWKPAGYNYVGVARPY